MSEEKEVVTTEEDEVIPGKEAEKSESEKGEEKSEVEQKDDFSKDEVVPAGKYNQAVRKQRELEMELRDLKKTEKPIEGKKAEEEEKDEEDEDFFKEEEKKELPDPSKLIDEKLKPVYDSLKKREENDRKVARTSFFESHPQYLNDSEKWQELLDEMDNSLNPNSKDDYFTQLEKAHRILSADSYNAEIEDKKTEMAADAASGAGAEKVNAKEEFNAEDRGYMKTWNISEEGMRAFKKDLKEGKTTVLA